MERLDHTALDGRTYSSLRPGHGWLEGWQWAPTSPALGTTQVHVWLADLDTAASDHEALWRGSSSDEQRRAAKFRSSMDGARFLAGRRLIRQLAGGYLESAPEEIALRVGPSGKPRIWCHGRRVPLDLTLSRSGGWGLFAFWRAGPVGVDIEALRSDLDLSLMSPAALTPDEKEAVNASGRTCSVHTFLRFWVRKEAYVKALGRGVGYGLHHVDVATQIRGRVVSPLDHLDPYAKLNWSIADMPDQPGFLGAICTKRHAYVSFWRWWNWF